MKIDIAKQITDRIKEADGRYWAGDNISQYIDLEAGEKELLIDQVTEAFETVLYTCY